MSVFAFAIAIRQYNINTENEPICIVPSFSIKVELLFKEWKKCHLETTLNNIVYVSINKRIIKNDLTNVFLPMSFKKSNYKFLFHNTQSDKIDESFLHYPLYTYLSPYMGLCDAYMGGRKCVIFMLKKNITNILDLTQSIVVSNPFVDYLKKDDKKQKKWTYYDNSSFLDYYENKNVPLKFHINNKCVSPNENENMETFMTQRKYCDIGTKRHYHGIRRLQEILFKTRKYHPGTIWIYKYLSETYQKMGYNTHVNLLYHPASKFSTNMDKHTTDLLLRIGANGYFATDHEFGFKSGGELMLTTPIKYLTLYKKSKVLCKYKDAFSSSNLMRHSGKKYAIVATLPCNNEYFYGMLVAGYSIKITNTCADLIGIVTDNISAYQRNELLKVYDIIHEYDRKNIKGCVGKGNPFFLDNLCRLEAFKFEQYNKILITDVDILVLKNIDQLFELQPPAITIGSNKNGMLLISPNKHEYDAIFSAISKHDLENYDTFWKFIATQWADSVTTIDSKFNFALDDQFIHINGNEISNKNIDAYIIHYTSNIKPWDIIYEYNLIERYIKHEHKQYYIAWVDMCHEINRKFNFLPEYLIKDDTVTQYVHKNLQHLLVSSEYDIISPLYDEYFVTDINVKNYVKSYNDIQKIKNIKYPNNIKFMFILLGNYNKNADKYIKINWDIIHPKISKYDKTMVTEMIMNSEKDDNEKQLILNMNPMEQLDELRFINKYKVFDIDDNLMNATINIEEPPVAYYAVKYGKHFIFVKIAYIVNSKKKLYQNLTHQLFGTGSNIYLYRQNPLLLDHSKNATDHQIKCPIRQSLEDTFEYKCQNKQSVSGGLSEAFQKIINHKYDMYKQLYQQLYYLSLINSCGERVCLDKNEFIGYYHMIINNINKSMYCNKEINNLINIAFQYECNMKNDEVQYTSHVIGDILTKLMKGLNS